MDGKITGVFWSFSITKNHFLCLIFHPTLGDILKIKIISFKTTNAVDPVEFGSKPLT